MAELIKIAQMEKQVLCLQAELEAEHLTRMLQIQGHEKKQKQLQQEHAQLQQELLLLAKECADDWNIV